jgi:hypothetical protein
MTRCAATARPRAAGLCRAFGQYTERSSCPRPTTGVYKLLALWRFPHPSSQPTKIHHSSARPLLLSISIMKSVLVLASLAACALAQRLHIAEPTQMQNIGTGQYFTAELHMDVRTVLRIGL